MAFLIGIWQGSTGHITGPIVSKAVCCNAGSISDWIHFWRPRSNRPISVSSNNSGSRLSMAISRSDWGFVSSTKMLTGFPPTSESVSSSSGDGGGRASPVPPFWLVPVLPSSCFLIGPFEEFERFEVWDFDPVKRSELNSSDRSVPVETGSNRFVAGCSFGFTFVRFIVGVPDLEEFRLDDRIGWGFGFWILVPDLTRFGLVARDPILELAFDPILDPFLGKS